MPTPAVTPVIRGRRRPMGATSVHVACVTPRRRTPAHQPTRPLIGSHLVMRDTVHNSGSTVRNVIAIRLVYPSVGKSLRRARRNTFRPATVHARPVITGDAL